MRDLIMNERDLEEALEKSLTSATVDAGLDPYEIAAYAPEMATAFMPRGVTVTAGEIDLALQLQL